MSALYVRLPDELHSKLRVIAALKNESLNAAFIAVVQNFVEEWERKYGALPEPPQED